MSQQVRRTESLADSIGEDVHSAAERLRLYALSLSETGHSEQPSTNFPQLRGHEIEMLRLSSEGFVDKQIAAATGVSFETVHDRWRPIRKVLKAKTRSQAVAIALGLGLIPYPSGVGDFLSSHSPDLLG